MDNRLYLADLAHLTPELTIVITAVVLTLLDLIMPKRMSRDILSWLSLAGIALSLVLVALKLGDDPVSLLNDSFRVDDFGNLFKLLILGGTGLIAFMSIGSTEREGVKHVGELYYLLLPAALGAMIMVSSADFITLFVGLELLSITSYILVGLRKKHSQSSEGAFKYVVLGSIASAFLLYGFSFLFGIAGSTNLAEVAEALRWNFDSYSALIYLGFFLMIAGFGFKIAAAPFHHWAPDVYQGAPLPVTAFLAAVSKGAAIGMMFRVMYILFLGQGSQDLPLSDDMNLTLTVLAAAAMIIGNFMALRQRNMKRLLALSGVANAGYLLVPLAGELTAFHINNFAEIYYYLIAYFLMNIGAIAVLSAVSASSGDDEMSGFAGLYYRAPWTAIAMFIFVLSLAGLPVTAGFFGKMFILLGAIHVELYWLAIVMIVTSIASFYYYFAIVKQMFMRSETAEKPVHLSVPQAVTIWACAAATVVLGFFPQWVLGGVNNVFDLFWDFFV